jgi:aspartate aminotransferase
MPTLEQIAPHLGDARMLCINSPLNPAGTVIDPEELQAITRAVVEENDRRTRAGKPHLFLLHDQVYGALVFGGSKHVHPVSLVPEAAPWVISLDGVSKAFAATGLRVGWVLAAPAVVARMKDLVGHMGAWAPRPEQVAFAEFLSDEAACREFHSDMKARVQERLDALHAGVMRLRSEGLPVDCVHPQGAIYLSLHLDVIGKSLNGVRLETNEELRKALLERAGLAVVPFQAFGLKEDTGWFRLSVGAVTLQDIEQAFPRLRRLLSGADGAW